jgi:hypothetical protein
MIAAIPHKTPPAILDKLVRLLNSLEQVNNHYESVAKATGNLQLKLSILALAQESKQYANELIGHIESLGGELHDKFKVDFNHVSDLELKEEAGNDQEGLVGLKLGEAVVLKTYRDVLNEPYLYDTIRQMIRYQQNGLLHCFSQIRMLYATMLKAVS